MDRLNELSLTDFARMDRVSDKTAAYSAERLQIMGRAPKSTKLVKTILNLSEDYVIFYFLTEATEKYGDDHVYQDIVPEHSFGFERDPSALYEIQLLFSGVTQLQGKKLTQADVRQFLWNTDFAVWSNAPSFHWQGFNYNMSQLGAAIHPTNIKPERWDKVHGSALIDKHLVDLFHYIKYYLNQMAPALMYQLRTSGATAITTPTQVQERVVRRSYETEVPYDIRADFKWSAMERSRASSEDIIRTGERVEIHVVEESDGSVRLKILNERGLESVLQFDSRMEAIRSGWKV